jgi:hypothetical protein
MLSCERFSNNVRMPWGLWQSTLLPLQVDHSPHCQGAQYAPSTRRHASGATSWMLLNEADIRFGPTAVTGSYAIAPERAGGTPVETGSLALAPGPCKRRANQRRSRWSSVPVSFYDFAPGMPCTATSRLKSPTVS